MVTSQCAQQLETDANERILSKLNGPLISLLPAILVYRVFRNEPKKNIKLLHGIIHLLALIISIVGENVGREDMLACARVQEKKKLPTPLLIFFSLHAGFAAVFEFHKAAKIPDMYSLHSWCGMATLVLFCIQVCAHTHTHTAHVAKNTGYSSRVVCWEAEKG